MSLGARVYNRLPVGVRSLAASGYGYLLRRRRYGPETDRLVQEALERERWPAVKLQSWQEERLAELLRHAARTVPYYREQWEVRRRRGDRSSVEELGNWPVLTKQQVKENGRALLSEAHPARELSRFSTSGSTGTPTVFWRSRAGQQHWYALSEARWRNWYGVSRDDSWAIMGGKMVTPFERDRPPYWVWNRGLRQLYLSIFHLKPENAAAYVEALRDHRVVYLYGYSSSMATLARFILEQGLEAPRLKVVISNAEPLDDGQRDLLARAFNCPVHTSYGMSEAVAGASECEHGALHLWPEAGVLEILADDEDRPVAPGSDGRMVATGLLDPAMPLVRYEIGDRGALSAHGRACPCGRTLPRLERIVGRLNDNVVSPDGRRIYQVARVFAGARVREAQIIQEERTRFIIRVVPDQGFGGKDERMLVRKLRETVGDVNVGIEPVESIPRLPNGKFRGVINKVEAV